MSSESSAPPLSLGHRTDWWTLAFICIGMVMIVANIAAIAIILPAIKADLHLSDASLVWVVDSYSVTYAGFLMVSGRLGDLLGYRRLLLWGLSTFAFASFGCALASSSNELIAARCLAGCSGAVVTTSTLPIVTNMFSDPIARTKAIGVYVFSCSAGGILGLVLGGVLASAASWRWVFGANLPLTVLAYGYCFATLPRAATARRVGSVDFAGAIVITASVMIGVYAIVNGNQVGWLSINTLALVLAAAILFMLFLRIEGRLREPLVPLGLLRNRNVVVCCVASALYATASSAAILVSIFLQSVLGYEPFRAGLVFIPSALMTAAFALGLSAKLMVLYGVTRVLVVGLLAVAGGLSLFGWAPVETSLTVVILPAQILLGVGAGATYSAVFTGGMNSVPQSDAGLVSGIIDSASIIGSALGVAVLVTVAASRTKVILESGADVPNALNAGYHMAFFVGATIALFAALVTAAVRVR